MAAKVSHADLRAMLPGMAAESFDAVVTDPPYEIGFMGHGWDKSGVAYDVEVWRSVLRVVKPGAHLVAFGGTKSFARMSVAIEDAGWEIRDTLLWLYSTSMPKGVSLDKAIDRARNSGRDEVLRATGWIHDRCAELGLTSGDLARAAGVSTMAGHWVSRNAQPAVPTLEQWQKIEPLLGSPPEWMLPLLLPASEPGTAWEQRQVVGVYTKAGDPFHLRSDAVPGKITLPATDAAKEWQGWGTALKPSMELVCLARRPLDGTVAETVKRYGTGGLNIDGCRIERGPGLGGWPTNVAHDGSDDVVKLFPEAKGQLAAAVSQDTHRRGNCLGEFNGQRTPSPPRGDTGSAARFFYCAKASRAERSRGLPEGTLNRHATVKPIALMRWLVRLITPPGGLVLDPFTGSGSTGVAAVMEGADFYGLELVAEHAEVARQRIEAAEAELRDAAERRSV